MKRDHRAVFSEVTKRYSVRELGRLSGIHYSRISRFMNRKVDLHVGEFIRLLESIRPEEQDAFWSNFLTKPVDKYRQKMDISELAKLLTLEEVGELLIEKSRTDEVFNQSATDEAERPLLV